MIIDKFVMSNIAPEQQDVAWYNPEDSKLRFCVDGEWKEAGASELQPASADTLGGVKVGDGVATDSQGTLSLKVVDLEVFIHPEKFHFDEFDNFDADEGWLTCEDYSAPASSAITPGDTIVADIPIENGLFTIKRIVLNTPDTPSTFYFNGVAPGNADEITGGNCYWSVEGMDLTTSPYSWVVGPTIINASFTITEP